MSQLNGDLLHIFLMETYRQPIAIYRRVERIVTTIMMILREIL